MKGFINLVAIILILFGIFTLGYNRYTYTTKEKVAEIGNVEVTAEKEKTIYLSPTMGGVAIGVGLILLIARRFNK